MLKKNLILSLFTSFLTLFLAEIFSYLYLENFASPYLKAKRLLRPDTSLSWVQRADLDTSFFGRDFKTNQAGFRENNKSFDTLIMGPSSTVGWGVEQEYSYAAILEKNSKLTVFNGGQIGYSIVQGHQIFLQNFASHNIKNLVLAYGINDIDFFAFDVLKTSSLDFSHTYFLTRNLLHSHNQMHPCPKRYKVAHRVPLKRYKEYLNKFYEHAKTTGAKLVLINTAHNYQGFDNESKKDLSKIEYEKYLKSLDNKDCDKARESFLKAQQLEAYRIVSDSKQINQLLKEFSEQENIYLLDIANSMSLKPEFFVDPVHFSEKGNEFIAQKLKEILSKEE
jgi:lysophospholipase L1-like esterase